MPKTALVVNPFATRVSDERIAEIERELGAVGELEIVLTERPGHATEIVTDACHREVDAVIVFSGDGGFNEALNGLERDVPVGFIPGGGTSVLPRALGIPRDPVDAARQLAEALSENRTRRISLGRVGDRRFAFSAGVGLDAEAVRLVDDARGRNSDGKRPGDLAFAFAIVRALAAERGHLEPQLEIAGHGRAAVAFISNGSPYSYAGALPLPIAPEAEFELGLDVVAPVRVRRRTLMGTVLRILAGRTRRGPYLYGHDLDRVEIRCDHPMPLQVDGEDLGDVTEAVFEAERDAVSVLV